MARRWKAERLEGGFTLIELMVVLLIIGVLIAIALPTFLGARTQSQDRAAQADLRTALAAGLTYWAQSGEWDGFDPASASDAEPALTWIDGGAPISQQISIHVHVGSSLLLVRRSGSGMFFCVAQIPGSPATARGGATAFADVDTTTECDGGW